MNQVRRRLSRAKREVQDRVREMLGPEPPGPRDFPDVANALNQLTAYSMAGRALLENLWRLSAGVRARGIGGDYVECGVHNGGSAAATLLAWRGETRTAWLYDSFQGLPAPREKLDGPDAAALTGKLVGSQAKVREALAIARWPEPATRIRAGWFNETFVDPLPARIAMLHIDADWYDSVMLCFETFYDRVPPGGIIVLDDFGHWEGCREAFYDFVARRGEKPLIERRGHTQAWWEKGRTHNRDLATSWER